MYKLETAERIMTKFEAATLVATPDKYVRSPVVQIKVPSQKLRDLCRFLRSNEEFSFDLPNHMTAIDYLKEGVFELAYFLYSTGKKEGLVIKTQIPRNDPHVDSVTDIWPGFDFQEREVFDLFGIEFKGHPNLKRIMMWDGFPGFPLRKDYVHVTDRFDSGLEIGTPGFDEKGLLTKKEAK
jgi:NADH-quinone oxidoreductase subunit C